VTSRRIAIGVISVTVVLFVARYRYVLAVATGSLSDKSGLTFNLIYGVGVVLFCALFVFVGWSVVTRRPWNAIGWILAITQLDGRLRFVVRDHGAGFDPNVTAYGTGLQGMADRLDAIAGSILVQSSAGEGTTVTGTVPVVEGTS
jgi:signal transduction histidine kinase